MTAPLRSILLALLMALVVPAPVKAQDGPGAAIRGVIADQIEAFRADDFSAAFDFASPGIRALFGTPEAFGAMVRGGYPMVWRPAEVTFGALEENAGVLRQQVIVRDAEGRYHALEYQMVPGPSGWRINGVRLLPAPDVGA